LTLQGFPLAKLTLTNRYEPNWTDPRVLPKVRKVLAWCDLMLSETNPSPVHFTMIIKIFGSSANKLGGYLKANLLIQSGVYTKKVKSFDYQLNKTGYDKIKAKVNGVAAYNDEHKYQAANAPQAVAYNDEHFFFDKHVQELKTLTFDYNLKSDRYWHAFQNIKRTKKYDFWKSHGLPHNYDIEACAPTILLGLATNLGMNHLLGQPINDYLNDKNALRSHLVRTLDLDPQDAKRLINSLFNGALLSASPYCAAYRLLGKQKMATIKADPQVRALRIAIHAMWERIKGREGKNYQVIAGQTIQRKNRRQELRRSRGKWSLYFSHERQILEIIKNELSKKGVKYFTEHDGFRTDREIDTAALEVLISSATTLNIKINKEE
jgi:hypothetical protein